MRAQVRVGAAGGSGSHPGVCGSAVRLRLGLCTNVLHLFLIDGAFILIISIQKKLRESTAGDSQAPPSVIQWNLG